MKKWISLLMALLMALCLLPATAVAAEPSEPVQQEVLQSEEPVQEEVSQKEEEQLPELMLAETEENAPAVLSASDDLDTRLSNAGFTAPQMGSMNGDHKDFYLCTPWQDNDCVSFDYDNSGIVGKLTVTLKPATLEQWKALYKAEQSDGFGFNDSLDVNIRSDAPSGTVRGAGALIWEAGCTNLVQDFLDGNLGSYMELYGVSSGYDSFGRYFPLISVEKRNGKAILSAESGETYYRYLMVWDNDNDDSSRLAQHNLFVTVKVESDIHYEWDVNTTMEDALRNAGYRVPTQKLFDVEMPDGLVEGVDYTYSYDASTGHVSIRLLKSDGWMKAFETCYDNNGYFGITTCFNKPSASAVKVKFYVTDDDDSVVQMYANNDLSEFSWYSGTNLRPGSIRTVINTYADSSGDMQLSAKAGTYWVRCIAVWGDKNGNILRNLNSQHKYMYTVGIEVPENFSYEWNTHPIEERLADAGFVAPQWDKNHDGVPGALDLTMPTGLKEGVDYTCDYNAGTGELNIAISAGTAADWKSAYLDSLINGCADRIIAAIRFRSENNAVRACSWLGGEDDLETLLRDGAWDSGDVYDVDGSMYVGNGAYLTGVWSSGGNTVTISRGNGALTFYRAALWRDANGGETKYLVKVTITCAAFSHTVKAPVTDTLNAVDTARFTLDLADPGLWMTNILSQGKVTLVPKAGAALTDEAGYIGGFWVQAPAGYTLQSCYVDYGQGWNSQLYTFDAGVNGYRIPVDFRDIASDPHTAFTLGWKNDNANAADLIESFDVCIDSNWGKLSSSGGSPNALDVAAIYECLTQDKTPACGDKMACDVNLDGNVDIYDLQYLYECVAQNQ